MSVTAKVLINSKQAPIAATSEYAAPASTRTIIDKFTATNTSGGAVTLNVYLVPYGSTPGNSNLIIKDLSVASGATEDISKLQNQILAEGDSIQVVAGSATSITIRASGRECT